MLYNYLYISIKFGDPFLLFCFWLVYANIHCSPLTFDIMSAKVFMSWYTSIYNFSLALVFFLKTKCFKSIFSNLAHYEFIKRWANNRWLHKSRKTKGETKWNLVLSEMKGRYRFIMVSHMKDFK